MIVFFTLLYKLIPLYILILLGYVAAKVLGTSKETIAKLLIYIIAPMVVFYWVYTAKISYTNLSLPVVAFIISCSVCLLFLWIWKIFYKGNTTKYILAFTSWTWNTWYFWLPVVLILFNEKLFSLAVLTILWVQLYENSLWFFITSRGHYTVKGWIIKLLKLPTIYAFLVWLIFNILQVKLWDTIMTNIVNFKGAYTILWMMIIWMWLSTVDFKAIDLKFISLSFFAKFIIWPLIITLIIFIDRNFIHAYNPDIYNILLLISIVPLAANTVSLATEFKVHPEKAALTVFLSTIFALFYIPLVTTLFIFK